MLSLAISLGVSDNPFGLLIWAAILLGPALLGILRRFLATLGGAQGDQQSENRMDRAPNARGGASARVEVKEQRPFASDRKQGQQMWKQLLAGEELDLPVTAHNQEPPPFQPRKAPESAAPAKRRADSSMFPTETASERQSRTSMGERLSPEQENPYATAHAEQVRRSLDLATPKGGSNRRAIRAAILWSEILAPPSHCVPKKPPVARAALEDRRTPEPGV